MAVLAFGLAAAPAMADSSAGLSDTQLSIQGDDDPQAITVTSAAAGEYRIEDDTGVTPDAGCAQETPNSVLCSGEPPEVGIVVFGLGGGDVITVGADVPAEVYGDAGNDRIFATPLADHLEGGAGDDLVVGGAGDDQLYGGGGAVNRPLEDAGVDGVHGGPGSDTVSDGEAAGDTHDPDTLNGGCAPAACSEAELPGDSDLLSFWGDPSPFFPREGGVTVDLAESVAGEPGEDNVIAGFENVLTGPGDDIVRGDDGPNSIQSGAGADLVDGRGAVDAIDCGDDEDEFVLDPLDEPLSGCETPVAPPGPPGTPDPPSPPGPPAAATPGAPSGVPPSTDPAPPSPTGPSRALLARFVRSAAAGAARALTKTGMRRMLARGALVRGSAPAAGRVTYTLKVGGTLARGTKALRATGPYALRLKATRAGRKRLAAARRARATLTVRFVTRSGLVVSTTRKVTLRRSGRR